VIKKKKGKFQKMIKKQNKERNQIESKTNSAKTNKIAKNKANNKKTQTKN
jgi:hypothetical protein